MSLRISGKMYQCSLAKHHGKIKLLIEVTLNTESTYLKRPHRVRVDREELGMARIHARSTWQNGDSLERRISLEGMSFVSVCFVAFGCASECSL